MEEQMQNFEQITAELSKQKEMINSLSFTLSEGKISGNANDLETSGLKSFMKNGENLEVKSFNGTVANEGGHIISPKLQLSINNAISDVSVIRKLAKVESISTSSLEIIQTNGNFDAGWAMEAEPRSETGNANFVKKTIRTHELFAQPKASQRFLDDSLVNVESWLKEEVSHSFALLEAKAFINGDGQKMPTGILSASSKENSLELKSNLKSDDFIDLISMLPTQYQKNAAFVMHPETLSLIRKMKEDHSGRFLWNPSLETGMPSTILGIHVYQDKNMPRPNEKGQHIMLADFKHAYRIVDRSGIHLLRDPFTEKPFVKFYVTKRVGGDVVNKEAVTFMTLKV